MLFSNREVKRRIKQGGKSREELLKSLYENKKIWKTVLKYVAKHGGQEQDAEEVFQESIITLNRKISENNFELTSNLSTYFIGICKWNWVSHKRKSHQKYLAESTQQTNKTDEKTPESIYLSKEKKTTLEALTSQIGEKCQKMLELYGLSYTMQEIADELGYKNKNMSKKAVARCRERLRQLIQQSPRLFQILNVNKK